MEIVCEIIILESEKVNLGSQWWRSNRHGACFRLVEWLRLLSAPLTFIHSTAWVQAWCNAIVELNESVFKTGGLVDRYHQGL